MPRLLFKRVYHVPYSQVWPGSRGGQHGHVHLHAVGEFHLGRLHRAPGETLCARKPVWMERQAEVVDDACPRCDEILQRYRQR